MSYGDDVVSLPLLGHKILFCRISDRGIFSVPGCVPVVVVFHLQFHPSSNITFMIDQL